jgi:hypothetical protein
VAKVFVSHGVRHADAAGVVRGLAKKAAWLMDIYVVRLEPAPPNP